MPPWPGMSVPESLAPAVRLSIDSATSPDCAATAMTRPRTQAARPATARRPTSAAPATTTAATVPPMTPLQVLLGEMWLRNRPRLKVRPDRYANVSKLQTVSTSTSSHVRPASSSRRAAASRGDRRRDGEDARGEREQRRRRAPRSVPPIQARKPSRTSGRGTRRCAEHDERPPPRTQRPTQPAQAVPAPARATAMRRRRRRPGQRSTGKPGRSQQPDDLDAASAASDGEAEGQPGLPEQEDDDDDGDHAPPR